MTFFHFIDTIHLFSQLSMIRHIDQAQTSGCDFPQGPIIQLRTVKLLSNLFVLLLHVKKLEQDKDDHNQYIYANKSNANIIGVLTSH